MPVMYWKVHHRHIFIYASSDENTVPVQVFEEHGRKTGISAFSGVGKIIQ